MLNHDASPTSAENEDGTLRLPPPSADYADHWSVILYKAWASTDLQEHGVDRHLLERKLVEGLIDLWLEPRKPPTEAQKNKFDTLFRFCLKADRERWFVESNAAAFCACITDFAKYRTDPLRRPNYEEVAFGLGSELGESQRSHPFLELLIWGKVWSSAASFVRTFSAKQPEQDACALAFLIVAREPNTVAWCLECLDGDWNQPHTKQAISAIETAILKDSARPLVVPHELLRKYLDGMLHGGFGERASNLGCAPDYVSKLFRYLIDNDFPWFPWAFSELVRNYPEHIRQFLDNLPEYRGALVRGINAIGQAGDNSTDISPSLLLALDAAVLRIDAMHPLADKPETCPKRLDVPEYFKGGIIA